MWADGGDGMSTKKKIGYAIASVAVLAMIVIGLVVASTASKINGVFKANESLKSEGYYLSEFEFQMLGIAYHLDHGHYRLALSRLDAMHRKMTTREGLVKIPRFANADEKLDFYLNLQNPRTGAFYSVEGDPLVSYFGVTANMIKLIEELSVDAGRPFHLKYPLRFLDEIDTPAKLTRMMDDAGSVGWIGARFKAPYVSLIELRDLMEQDERLHVYGFRDDVKLAFHQWFYDHQDPDTGLWGPLDRASGKVLGGGDVGDSGKVIKMFVDNEGNDLLPQFPLRYVDRIFASSLEQLAEPIPTRLDELHRWILTKDRGFRFLTRYLWKKAPAAERGQARALMLDFVRVRFEHYFVRADGAFSLYPEAAQADLDGTGEAVGMYDYVGALSPAKQARLWGGPSETIVDLGTRRVAEIGQADYAAIADRPDLNALRFYMAEPGSDFLRHAVGVLYPRETHAPDLVDLLPRIAAWLDATPQTMGNWITKDSIAEDLAAVPVDAAPVLGPDWAGTLDAMLTEAGRVVVIGYDALQVPRYRLVLQKG